MAFQFTGLSRGLRDLSFSLTSNFYLALAIYLSLLGAGYCALTFPLDVYEGFILERRFSLSDNTFPRWFTDEVKKWAISSIIFLMLIESFYLIARCFGSIWWAIAAIFWIAFSIFFARLFPVLIMPLFYKFSTLRDGNLRKRALELAAAFNIKVMDVFEIDFSKKTKKANAAIVGWGDTKRVVLADNLINEFTQDEVVVVLAHEMAHYKLNHIWKLLALSAMSTGLVFFILSFTVDGLGHSLGSIDPFDIAVFPAIYLFFTIYGVITTPILNAVSRKLERDADILALKITRLKGPFVSLMKRLAEKNLSDENPGRLAELVFYDHPPVSKRIKSAEKF